MAVSTKEKRKWGRRREMLVGEVDCDLDGVAWRPLGRW